MRCPIDESKYSLAMIRKSCITDGLEYTLHRFAYYCPECGCELYGNLMSADDKLPDSALHQLLRKEYYYDSDRAFAESKKRREVLSEVFDYYIENSMILSSLKHCPVCNGKLSKSKGFYCDGSVPFRLDHHYENGLGFNSIFSKMKEERFEAAVNNSQIKVRQFSDNQKINNSVAEGIGKKLEAEELIIHIKQLFELETNIYDVEKRLESLYLTKAVLPDLIALNNQEGLAALFESYSTALVSVDVSEDADISDICLPVVEYDDAPLRPRKPKMPVKPNEPTFTLAKPVEPVYAKPGLFNKSKVIEENNKKKADYETTLNNYIHAENNFIKRKNSYINDLKKYEEEVSSFDARIIEYENAMKSYEEEVIKYEISCKEKEAQAQYQALIEARQEEQRQKNAELIKEIDCKRDAFINYRKSLYEKGIIVINKEIEIAEKLLSDMISALQKIYGIGIVYAKYRNMVAMVTFYDYLASGRCETLAGPNGAYNRFEDEIKWNVIITKLDDIVVSLDKIQDNQFMLYQKMCDIQNGIDQFNDSMNTVIKSVTAIEMNTEDIVAGINMLVKDTKNISENVASISENSSKIVKNTEMIAHYSSVNAYYSKKNAELTNALGYLVAFK